VDYRAGNLNSVVNAFRFLGAQCEIIDTPEQVSNAERLVLPGVGAFGWAASALQASGLDEPLRQHINQNRPFLGICLGLQLLFESSEESPGAKGLGVFKGEIKRLEAPGLKIPHIGWNSINVVQKGDLFGNLPQNEYFYFVHTFCAVARDRQLCAATAEYGQTFDAAVMRGNTAATQFHPEKSGDSGLAILKNFLS
jgi:glutamine amidotransferase